MTPETSTKSTDVLNEIITPDSPYCLDVRNEPEPDRRLSPAEALTYALDMVRVNGWEMPCVMIFRRNLDADADAHESDDAHFHWRSRHTAHVRRVADATDGTISAWRQDKDGRVHRAWPTTTVTSVGEALMFLFRFGEAAE